MKFLHIQENKWVVYWDDFHLMRGLLLKKKIHNCELNEREELYTMSLSLLSPNDTQIIS